MESRLSKLSRCYLAFKKLLSKTDALVLDDYSEAQTTTGVQQKAGQRKLTILLEVDGEPIAAELRIIAFSSNIPKSVPEGSMITGHAREIWK
jgi:hypothetical protein